MTEIINYLVNYALSKLGSYTYKALPQILNKATAQGESQVTNIAKYTNL